MNINELRAKISNQYMKNDVISAKEAKEIVGELAADGLTAEEKQGLESIRTEFKDGFSSSGMKAFDKALAKAPAATSTAPPSSGTSVLGLQLGRDLGHMPTEFKLSEISDPKVRDALSRLDVNTDGRVDAKDRDKMGFSDDQWRMFAFSALLLGTQIKQSNTIPQDLSGKTICFTAVADKDNLTKWAKAMGAKVVADVSPDLDFLIVGDASRTGKDERALILNTLGDAEIDVSNTGAFRMAAHGAGVTGAATRPISRARYDKAVTETLKDFYMGFLDQHYDDALASTSSTTEKKELRAAKKADVEGFDPSMMNPDELFSDMIEDKYASNDPYLDSFGQPIPEDQLDVINFDFFTEAAGIGLSKTFVFDRRTGDVVDEGDIQD